MAVAPAKKLFSDFGPEDDRIRIVVLEKADEIDWSQIREYLEADTADEKRIIAAPLVKHLFDETIKEFKMKYTSEKKNLMAELVIADCLGLGPVEVVLKAQGVIECVVIGHLSVEYRREGALKLADAGIGFASPRHLAETVARLAELNLTRLDEKYPVLQGKWKNWLVDIMIPPAAHHTSLRFRRP